MSTVSQAIKGSQPGSPGAGGCAAVPQLKVISPECAGDGDSELFVDPPAEAGKAETIPATRTLRLSARDDAPVKWSPASSSDAAEQYRILRTRVLRDPRKVRFVLVSSAAAGDGKTTTALNLAWALAVGGQGRVLLLEGDLRKPSLHVHIELPRVPGVAEVAAGDCPLHDALLRIEDYPNLYVLPAGKAAANPAELLSSRHWIQLCADVRRDFDFVIADSPPIAAAADFELIEAKCDGVLLVVRPDHTKRRLLTNALEKASQAKLLGIVLNSVPKWFMWKNEYYDFYKV